MFADHVALLFWACSFLFVQTIPCGLLVRLPSQPSFPLLTSQHLLTLPWMGLVWYVNMVTMATTQYKEAHTGILVEYKQLWAPNPRYTYISVAKGNVYNPLSCSIQTLEQTDIHRCSMTTPYIAHTYRHFFSVLFGLSSAHWPHYLLILVYSLCALSESGGYKETLLL